MDLIIYLYWINIITFILYVLDKRRAYFCRWRIPELLLLFFSLIGGAFGALLAMLMFRHKTKHVKFKICVPLFLLFQILFTFWVIHSLSGLN